MDHAFLNGHDSEVSHDAHVQKVRMWGGEGGGGRGGCYTIVSLARMVILTTQDLRESNSVSKIVKIVV